MAHFLQCANGISVEAHSKLMREVGKRAG